LPKIGTGKQLQKNKMNHLMRMEKNTRNFLLLAAGVGICFTSLTLASQEIDLLISPGKLSKPHAYLAGVANCTKCHTVKKKADPQKCLACHRDLAARIKAGRGWHRDKVAGCITCHPEHQGADFKLIEWDLKKFSHRETGYPLTGLHKKIADCAACHNPATALPGKKGKTYLIKDAGCVACHRDPHRGQLGTQCARCHSTEAPFRQVVFDHGKTRFPLKGAHKSLACGSCHPDKKWQGLSFKRCSDCHADPHQPSLGGDCRACHNETSWKTARFNHDQTRFPLRGKHSALACAKCHPRGEKAKKLAFAKCSDCHRQDPHAGKYGGDCQGCHVVEGFEKASFSHDRTRFPLTGKHAALSCQACHVKKGGMQSAWYKPLSTACADCHADVHRGQFAAACDSCHTTRGFTRGELKFNHQTDSSFPLLGKHATLSCRQCHLKTSRAFPSGQGEAVLYKPLGADCLDCHRDYHLGQLGKECGQCHGFDSFRPAPRFDHSRSRFSLQLFHENVGCRQCHPLVSMTVNGKVVQTVQYKNVSGECRECHRNFDHSRTAFPLTGVHGALDCRKCHNARTPNMHKNGSSEKGQTECTLCHSSPHPGLQKNCRECHSGKNWRVEPW
jgi:hypothetical protein